MEHIQVSSKIKSVLTEFIHTLESIYEKELICVILYGSAASGEYVHRHSDVNLLVVLKNADLENLKKVSPAVNKFKFRMIAPLFFSEAYIKSSHDVFPIEFLDMKENYTVLQGRDVLKDISVDMKHLRFQCEQELKVKLIALKQLYVKKARDKYALSNVLLKSFTSIAHILRNVLRIKGKQPPYLRQDILKEVALEFPINKSAWETILDIKNKQIKVNTRETEKLFVTFAKDLEKIVDLVDKLS
ncbi:MAG: hypothetical protein V1893_02590 [Candidatus Omnitrophota bacterium]